MPYLYQTKRLGSEMTDVDRFNAIKNFLSGNSYESSDGVVYIFPGKLLAALMEVSSMKSVEAESKLSNQTLGLNSSQLVTMNMSKTKNESSLSVVPSDVRLSKIGQTQDYEDNLFVYRMNVSRIVRKEKELNLKMGIILSDENMI